MVPEIALAKIRKDAPFDKVCYIGCGVTTGVGAVLFTAKVEAGANVVVFGLGGIGLNVIQGAKMVGADKIIGIDLNPAREAMARQLRHDALHQPEGRATNVVDAIVQLTDGGADYSFECIGNTTTMRQALECCHKGWGQQRHHRRGRGRRRRSRTRPFQLVTGRVWKGSAFGGARGRTDVPKIVDWYMDGKINIDAADHAHADARGHQRRLRADGARRVDPLGGGVLSLTALETSMRIETIRQRLRDHAARPVHEERVLRQWTQARPLHGGRVEAHHFLPLALREDLPALADALNGLARLRSSHAAEDGSERLLVDLADGQTVETVLLPRDGLCVSTQVGCAVGCVFCMTGRDGLLRQLGSAEIVAQVALARRRRAVRKVVFMGMGEPAHNLDNVLEAIDLLGTAGDIGHKNLVFSTVGDARVFERLPAGRVKPALALSLHSTDADAARAVAAARAAHRAGRAGRAGRTLCARHRLSDPVPVDAARGRQRRRRRDRGIVALLAGKYAMMNMIPYNAVDGLTFRRPRPSAAAAIARELHRRGVLTKLRQSAGQDVDAGCGQLRTRMARRSFPIATA